MAQPTSEWATDFTSANPTANPLCERDTCPTKVFPPGTQMHYMHSKDIKKAGRYLCSDCYEHYRQKITSIRRVTPGSAATMPLTGQQDQITIHQHVARAQRGCKSFAKIQDYHNTNHELATSNIVHAVGTPIPIMSRTPRYIVHTSAGPLRSTGPAVHLPGLPSLQGAIPAATRSSYLQGQSLQIAGYTKEHAAYAATRERLTQQAYTTQKGEVVIAEVRVVTKPKGRVKPVMFEVCYIMAIL